MCPSRHSVSGSAQARYDLLRHATPCSGTLHLARDRYALLVHALLRHATPCSGTLHLARARYAITNLRALLGFYISEMFLILSIFCDTRHSPELPHPFSPCTLLCDTSSVWEAERKTEREIFCQHFSSFFNISRVNLRCSPCVNISVTAVDDSS